MKPAIMAFTLLCLTISKGVCQEPTRSITQVKGDLYRFQNNNHYSVFLVTSEGVIATDPISKDAATWLNNEIKSRFGVAVKYLVYSHDHADHISGGEVFEEATVVGHELTKEAIIRENRQVPVPTITFSERMTLELGNRMVELYYPGKSHGDNCIAVYFPDARTVFVVDFITANRLPYRDLQNSFFPDWIESIKRVEALDFEIVAPGHGDLGTKEDVTNHRKYIQDLYTQVEEGIKAGKSLEAIKEEIDLAAYSNWAQYEAWRDLNIAGMYRELTAN